MTLRQIVDLVILVVKIILVIVKAILARISLHFLTLFESDSANYMFTFNIGFNKGLSIIKI